MACGAPVVAERIEACVETLNGGACFVEPADENALAKTLLQLLENDAERQRLSANGLRKAANFSWQKTMRLTLDAYEQVMRNRAT